MDTLKRHWPEYLMEAGEPAAVMAAACLFVVVLQHTDSPVPAQIPDGDVRRLLMGLCMAATVVAVVHSPWGRRSGAHLNPAVTLTFWRLGRVAPADAVAYALAHFAGAVAGVLLARLALGAPVAHPSVNFAVTMPGPAGVAAAFLAETAAAFVVMSVVLAAGALPRVAPYTGLLAGGLLVLHIFVWGPVSGMSGNPARTFGSALPAGVWTALWIYTPLGAE